MHAMLRSACCGVVMFLAGAACADYWVAPSPTGSDSNDGSQSAPFRSIQHAVDAAPDEGCVIHLAEGSYYVETGTTPAQMGCYENPFDGLMLIVR